MQMRFCVQVAMPLDDVGTYASPRKRELVHTLEINIKVLFWRKNYTIYIYTLWFVIHFQNEMRNQFQIIIIGEEGVFN